jgi:hypothetical protein
MEMGALRISGEKEGVNRVESGVLKVEDGRKCKRELWWEGLDS